MEEGFILMNLSMCLLAVEKYEKVESVNTKNDYETDK